MGNVGQIAANIAPEIADLAQPINRFLPHPRNARKHDLDRIVASLQAHGQRTPIVVQKSTRFIVKGNGTWAAAQKLAWDSIAVLEQDLDDTQAMAYLLADNRASDKAGYDAKLLIANLDEMVRGPGLWATGFDIDELEDLMSAADAVPIAEATPALGTYNEPADSLAVRKAASEREVEKQREIPLVYGAKEHALFTGWLKQLQTRWGINGVRLTVYEAVRRQAEAEDTGSGKTGVYLTGDTAKQERYVALREFRDLISTLGADREYRGTWLIGQLQAMMGTLGVNVAVAPPKDDNEPLPEPTVEEVDPALLAAARAIDEDDGELLASVWSPEATPGDPLTATMFDPEELEG